MARPLKIEFEGALYHITSRGNAKNNIYKTDDQVNKTPIPIKNFHLKKLSAKTKHSTQIDFLRKI